MLFIFRKGILNNFFLIVSMRKIGLKYTYSSLIYIVILLKPEVHHPHLTILFTMHIHKQPDCSTCKGI